MLFLLLFGKLVDTILHPEPPVGGIFSFACFVVIFGLFIKKSIYNYVFKIFITNR